MKSCHGTGRLCNCLQYRHTNSGLTLQIIRRLFPSSLILNSSIVTVSFFGPTQFVLSTTQLSKLIIKKNMVVELLYSAEWPRIGYFLEPTLMHTSILTCMSHYPRHVSGLDMPIFRSNNCTNTASGILALEISERSYIKLVQGLLCC